MNDAVPGAVLSAQFPQMETEPPTDGVNYTIENFRAREEWLQKCGTPCLLVFVDLINLPVYSMDGVCSANSVIVVPQYRLFTWREKIESGKALWAPLAEAIAALKVPQVAPPPAPDCTEVSEKLSRLRLAATGYAAQVSMFTAALKRAVEEN